MPQGTRRRLRAALRNALLWGLGWSAAGLTMLLILGALGRLPDATAWLEGLGIVIRLGIWGVFSGIAFAGLMRLLYHGRRLSDISWVRFGLLGGIATGVFVPLFMQVLNVLSGDGPVAWHLVTDDAVWATVAGALAAGGSLRLAQRAQALSAPGQPDQLDPGPTSPSSSVPRTGPAGTRHR